MAFCIVSVILFGTSGAAVSRTNGEWNMYIMASSSLRNYYGGALELGSLNGASDGWDDVDVPLTLFNASKAYVFSYEPSFTGVYSCFLTDLVDILTGVNQKTWTVITFPGSNYSPASLMLSFYADSGMEPPAVVGGKPYEYVITVDRDPTGTFSPGTSFTYPAGASGSFSNPSLTITFNNMILIKSTSISQGILKGIRLYITARPVNSTSYTITGRVKTIDGSGVSDVTATVNNSWGTSVTGSDGVYSVVVPEGWSGNLTLSTDAKHGYWFQTQSASFSNITADTVGPDFIVGKLTDISASAPRAENSAIAWADFDNDGRLDFAMAGWGYVNSSYLPIARIYRNNGDGTFTDIAANLTGVYHAELAWGDYDNDGRLDLVLTGQLSGGSPCTKLYHNDGGSVFHEVNAGFVNVTDTGVAWGDYDGDGRLDLAIGSSIYHNENGPFRAVSVGIQNIATKSVAWADFDTDGMLDLAMQNAADGAVLIYHNSGDGTFTKAYTIASGCCDGSLAWGDHDNDGYPDLAVCGSGHICLYHNDSPSASFTPVNIALPINVGVSQARLAWGDYDSDGRPDLLIMGTRASACSTVLYHNDGGGVFHDANAVLVNLSQGGISFGDYDSDGRLDIALTGAMDNSGSGAFIYHNDYFIRNTPPTAPTGLSASFGSTGGALFTWNAATDSQTPAQGLSYNLRVGSAPGKDDILSGNANAAGLRRLPNAGNAGQGLSWTLPHLPRGTYYWSVQAIDTAFAGSPWAAEHTLTTSDTPPADIVTVTVLPAMVAEGDPVSVRVDTADGSGTVSVTANGAPLTQRSNNLFEGVINAEAGLGRHAVTIIAKDAVGNSSTDSSSYYTTVANYGISGRALHDAAARSAAGKYVFTVWGRVVAPVDTSSFYLNDGSGQVVKVLLQAHGFVEESYVSARGTLSYSGGEPVINAHIAQKKDIP